MGPSQFRRLVSTSPENLKKSWMSFFFGISLHLNGHQECCSLFQKVNGHGMDMRKNLSTHTTWDTKNWLLKSKSPSFPHRTPVSTQARPKLFHGVSTHPSIRGRPARVGCRCNFGAKHRGKSGTQPWKMNVRDRRWPGWTVDESCSFSTKVGDPTFLPTNVDTLTLFFFRRGPNPSQISRNPSQNREKYLVVSFRNFFGGISWLKKLQTDLWLAQIYTASQPNLHKWPVFWSTKGQARFVRAANLQNSVELQNQRAL